MPTRSEIQDTLAASQEQVLAYFDGLSPEALERPCTASGVPGEAPWRAKDHFAHLSANEQGILTLLRLTLRGRISPGLRAEAHPRRIWEWSLAKSPGKWMGLHRRFADREIIRRKLSRL
jgi:hypothetical protein